MGQVSCYAYTMNVHIRPSSPATTQAAEGLPRRKWSVAEIEAMVQAGIIDEHERIELIGGEIVPMAAKGVPHETIKKELNRFWAKIVTPEIDIITETTFRLDAHQFLEPDFLFWPRSVGLGKLKPADIMLAVEVADSSLAWDLGRKAGIYASLSLPEYWVINARTLVTTVHREPGPEGFAAVAEVAHTSLLTPMLIPALAVRLADLGSEPLAA